jgi:transcriptional regulator of acetoin/glycerol metabolism
MRVAAIDATLNPEAHTPSLGARITSRGVACHWKNLLSADEWRGNLREFSHTLRTMTLFCEGPVVLPEHVLFPPDLGSSKQTGDGKNPTFEAGKINAATVGRDLSLSGAIARHLNFVYQQTGKNLRRTAKLLGISRATLIRRLRRMGLK